MIGIVTASETGEPAAASSVAARVVPELEAGIELIGVYRDSGYREPPYLARRADGQVVQLSRLLYLVADRLDGRRTYQGLAAELSDKWERVITPDQVSFLVENRLRPAGMVAADGHEDQSGAAAGAVVRRADRLLALRFRVALVPERVVSVIARVFQPLFWPPVLIIALAGLVVADAWLVVHGKLAEIIPSAHALINQPSQTLLVFGVLLALGVFHECGHVAACRYGGAKPGAMGVGIYLVWPAMYSTVTDSYRLGRVGRLRTDLGGIYFNALSMIVMVVLYAHTGLPWLLVALVAWHGATVWQFLPSIRLDGYYILSDLVGVPDLFDRMGPVLRSLFPGRGLHPRVRELKPWTRRVIALWVVLVIPCLAYWLILFLVLAPYVLPAVWRSLLHLSQGVGDALQAGQPATAAVGVLQIFVLVLPWAGMTLILAGIVRRLFRSVRALVVRRSTARRS